MFSIAKKQLKDSFIDMQVELIFLSSSIVLPWLLQHYTYIPCAYMVGAFDPVIVPWGRNMQPRRDKDNHEAVMLMNNNDNYEQIFFFFFNAMQSSLEILIFQQNLTIYVPSFVLSQVPSIKDVGNFQGNGIKNWPNFPMDSSEKLSKKEGRGQKS